MSPKFDSPVQTQMAVALLNPAVTNELHSKNNSGGKPAGRRRVFVQTETGLLLDMELHRGDNVHTVKRRLQVAFNFPTEESSLTFGDLVLKNDLSAVRGDSPLLLTRNSMHRSSSTPCLSPRVKDVQQKALSGPIEILGHSSQCARLEQLIKDVAKAIKNCIDPISIKNGLGGAYYFRNTRGDKAAIVKPTDEEPFAPNNPKGFIGKSLGQPGLKRSVRIGETGFREVAAYLLDYNNFANVPLTALVKITHSVFHVNDGVNRGSSAKPSERKQEVISKIASLQQFIPHDFDAGDLGTSSFPVAAVHRIGILDVRILNTDRHAGNLLVRKVEDGFGHFGGKMELIPIDHGLCLPESLEDPYFEWIHWPQASVPFSEDELEYIANLDPAKDCDMLRRELPMIHEACLRVLVLCTVFLKEAAIFGLCLAEIGEMMTREFKGMEEEPSELEVVCMEARKLLAEREAFFLKSDQEDENDFLFHIEYEEDKEPVVFKSVESYGPGYKAVTFRSNLSKLDETLEEEEDEEKDICNVGDAIMCRRDEDQHVDVRKLSASLKGVSLTDKASRYFVGYPKMGRGISKSDSRVGGDSELGNSRSAYDQLSSSSSFVKLADMSEEEWLEFLTIFCELLPDAFRGRKSSAAAFRMKQRLGTSCQF